MKTAQMSPSSTPMHGLQLLGEPAWHGTAGALRFRLLGYVAAQRRPVDRDHLAFLFWLEVPNEVARRNLRKAWFDLRRLPELASAIGLHADSTTVAWSDDSDLARLQAQLEAGDTRAAVQTWVGPLLQGMDGGSVEFQRWLEPARTRLTTQSERVNDFASPLLVITHSP